LAVPEDGGYLPRVRFIALQTDPVWQDAAENRRRIEGTLDASGFSEGDYAVLPEMCETGWTTDTRALSAITDSVEWFSSIARARRIWIQAGFGEHRGAGRFANSVVVIGPDGVPRATYRKNFLFPSERDSFEVGSRIALVDTGTAVVCPLICYDLRFPELWRIAARAGAEVFAVSSSWPRVRHEHWRALLVARAIENQACVIAANRCGRDPSSDYIGGSVAVNEQGVRLGEASDSVQCITLEYSAASVRAWREKFGALRDTRPSLLGSIDIDRH
jgi:predicted amidohydrolase